MITIHQIREEQTVEVPVLDQRTAFLKKLTMGGGIVFHGIYSTQSVYFQATGKRGVSLFLSLCSHIICLIPSAMILLTFAGNTKIWYAFPLSGFASMVISCLLMKTMTKDR